MAKILITEDEDGLRRFVARALQLDGHETVEAADGAEGLACLQGDRFDLLLSDIRMPVMDGIELAHQASAAFPALKILLMTGYAEQRERADNLTGKVIDVVSKPFTLPDIRQGGRGRACGLSDVPSILKLLPACRIYCPLKWSEGACGDLYRPHPHCLREEG